jgi:hypothetical protein
MARPPRGGRTRAPQYDVVGTTVDDFWRERATDG